MRRNLLQATSATGTANERAADAFLHAQQGVGGTLGAGYSLTFSGSSVGSPIRMSLAGGGTNSAGNNGSARVALRRTNTMPIAHQVTSMNENKAKQLCRRLPTGVIK